MQSLIIQKENWNASTLPLYLTFFSEENLITVTAMYIIQRLIPLYLQLLFIVITHTIYVYPRYPFETRFPLPSSSLLWCRIIDSQSEEWQTEAPSSSYVCRHQGMLHFFFFCLLVFWLCLRLEPVNLTLYRDLLRRDKTRRLSVADSFLLTEL